MVQQPVPTVIPWRHTLITAAAALVITLPAYLTAGPGAALGAMAGMVVGGFAAMSGTVWRAGLVGVATVAATAVVVSVPSVWTIVVISALFIASVGLESARVGTRTAVMALFGFLMAIVGLGFGGDWPTVPFMALGVVGGALTVHGLAMAGLLPKLLLPPVGAVALMLFLGIGLALSFILIAMLDEPRSYWIGLLFVGRAIVPFEAQRKSALRFGRGAMVGVIVAMAVQALTLPAAVQLMIAFAAGVIGLRTLPHPLPIASGCFTVSILLSTATTFGEAVFRAEAIAIVVGIILVVSFGIDRLWAVLLRAFPAATDQTPHGSS